MQVLVTGGCSFSECISPWITTWPKHLEKMIDPKVVYHEAIGGQGNDNISREIIYRISQLLKIYQPDDILVGIMWSGPDRKSIFLNYSNIKEKITHGMSIVEYGQTLGVLNPYNWVTESDQAGWLLLGGNDSKSKLYYTELHHFVEAQITTIEHVLRLQWFLKLYNIKYFMTTYTNEVFDRSVVNNANVKYLYDQIDFDSFLPVAGEYEWCRDFSNLDFPVAGDYHPSTEQHKLFTEQVIVPFLQNKEYL
jgi:hypothetical protein